MNLIKPYYQLIKPGIVYGNAVSTVAGFFFASSLINSFNSFLLLFTLLGSSFVIGSACVLNNIIDRDIDRVMNRTKKRPIVSGEITSKKALFFGLVLAFLGFFILTEYTNFLTVFIGLLAFFFYVVLYGFSKRSSVHGTLVGSVAGSAPIVAGYTAVIDRFDLPALILFLILMTWQMAHFYAISIYRFNDYKEAKIPVLPIVKGIEVAKRQIVFYIILFCLSSLSLTFFGYTGYIYLILVGFIGIIWLLTTLKSYKHLNEGPWARKVFFFSLITLVGFSILISIGALLP